MARMLNQNPLRAALWMGGAVLSFSLMAIAVRELLRHMGAFEILFLRTLVTLALIVAVVARAGFATVRTRLFWQHFARALMHLGGQYCWIYALGALTLAMVFAIEFTMPVWVALLASVFLGERLNRGRVLMLVLGLSGIAIILRPDLGGLDPAALVMVLGSVFFAGNMIMTKRISASDSPLTVIFWMSVTQLPLTFFTALPQWVPLQPIDFLWALVIGSGSFAAHYSMTRAMKLGDATLVVPIDFLRLPLIAMIGALLYQEALEAATFIGAAVIFAGTYFSLVRETRRS